MNGEEGDSEGTVEDWWWKQWRERDYSWDALKKRTLPDSHSLAGLAERGDITLQDYWRVQPGTNIIRTDDRMKQELVEDPEGRVWHIAHVPLRWPDGTAAKSDWSPGQRSRLTRLINNRLRHSAQLTPDGSCDPTQTAHFEGVVFAPGNVFTETLNVSLHRAYVDLPITARRVSASFRAMAAMFTENVIFTQAVIEGELVFEQSVFLSDIFVGHTRLPDYVTFSFVSIEGRAIFHRTKFEKNCDFYDMQTYSDLEFDDASFGGDATFNNSEFYGYTSFKGTEFQGIASFTSSNFYNRLDFQNAKFTDAALFNSVKWENGIFFDESEYPVVRTTFNERCFYNTRFSSTAVFRDVGFHSFSAYDGAIFDGRIHFDHPDEKKATALFRSQLADALQDEDPETRLEALHGGCQTLRRAMEEASDKRREFLLHQFELLSRRSQRSTPSWEKAFSFLYDWTSAYGSSISRPVLTLIFIVGFCGIFYGVLGGLAVGVFDFSRQMDLRYGDWRPLLEGLSFSASRSFPFGPWTFEASAFQKALLGNGGSPLSFIVRLIGTIQSAASLVLIFLSALAVRRRFQVT